jgi:hypothetical protein
MRVFPYRERPRVLVEVRRSVKTKGLAVTTWTVEWRPVNRPVRIDRDEVCTAENGSPRTEGGAPMADF